MRKFDDDVLGIVIGPMLFQAVIFSNGKPTGLKASFETHEECIAWAKVEWKKHKEELGTDMCKFLKYGDAELRIF